MKKMPKIEKFMKSMPHTVGQDIPITKALEMMREFHIRHLPVQAAGKLVGVVSDRDIKLAASFAKGEDLTVEDIMTPDPFTSRPHNSLDQVILEMIEHKYGCAIITQDNGKVVGIFTAIDGLIALNEVLYQHYKTGSY